METKSISGSPWTTTTGGSIGFADAFGEVPNPTQENLVAAVRCSHVLGGKRDGAVPADGQCAALRALPFEQDLKNPGASRTLFRRFPIRISSSWNHQR